MTRLARHPVFSSYQWPRPSWRCRVDVLEPGLRPFRHVRRIVEAADRYRVLVLDGFDRADLVAAAIVARRRRPPTVLVLDPTWKSGDSLAERAATRAGVRFIDGAHVTYAVLSTFEVGSFPTTWGVAPDRVTFIPWHFDLADDELAQPVSVEGGFVAGGDSLRDYPTLLRAARAAPAPVTIATRATPKDAPIPPNVSVRPAERSRYDELLRSATAVVLPLQVRRDRSSGQGTLLNAMAHGKTVIVNDAPGVRDYVEDRRTAIVVRSGDADGLSAAMHWVLAHPNEAAEMGARARADVLERFSPERYVERVLAAVDVLLDGALVPGLAPAPPARHRTRAPDNRLVNRRPPLDAFPLPALGAPVRTGRG